MPPVLRPALAKPFCNHLEWYAICLGAWRLGWPVIALSADMPDHDAEVQPTETSDDAEHIYRKYMHTMFRGDAPEMRMTLDLSSVASSKTLKTFDLSSVAFPELLLTFDWS